MGSGLELTLWLESVQISWCEAREMNDIASHTVAPKRDSAIAGEVGAIVPQSSLTVSQAMLFFVVDNPGDGGRVRGRHARTQN